MKQADHDRLPAAHNAGQQLSAEHIEHLDTVLATTNQRGPAEAKNKRPATERLMVAVLRLLPCKL